MKHNEVTQAVRAFSLLRKGGHGLRLGGEGYWSYPSLLTSSSGEVTWLFIVLGIEPLPQKRRTALFRPRLVVKTLENTNTVIQYTDLKYTLDPFRFLQWDRPVAMFPHQSISEMSYDQFEREEQNLLSQYPEVSRVFSKRQVLPQGFADSFMELTHPIFLPYIRHLAPEFFTALNCQRLG